MRLELATNEEIKRLTSNFIQFNTHHLEEPKRFYPFIGIMDVYKQLLTEEQARYLLNWRHTEKFGSRFLTTITQMYHIEHEVYVHFHTKELDKAEFKYILSTLNKLEAGMFRKLFDSGTNLYKIGDEEALQFLVNLSINELYFLNFFFPSLETVLIGNFELCFPIYSKNKQGFENCREIIERNFLFLRE